MQQKQRQENKGMKRKTRNNRQREERQERKDMKERTIKQRQE